MTVTRDRVIDLLDGELYAGDPYPTYAWMREHAPVYWDAQNELWGIARYDDIVEIERAKDVFISSDTVKGGLCCSGMFDLKPVRLSARSSYVKFTDEIEQALSSQRHLDKLNAPVIVAYGSLETPEFQRQSRDFAAAVKTAGKPVQLLVADGYNHFEIPETLANPYGLLGRAVLAQMNLSQG